jgi:hypothetical protein
MINAGAKPNEITSTSESSSDPKRDPLPVARATLPSSASATPPSTINVPAKSNWPRDAEIIENTPQKRFASVSPLGRTTTARRILRGGFSADLEE